MAYEREAKLRQALETTGMLRSAYWASWMTFEIIMDLESTLLLCALGAAWQVCLDAAVQQLRRSAGQCLSCTHTTW